MHCLTVHTASGFLLMQFISLAVNKCDNKCLLVVAMWQLPQQLFADDNCCCTFTALKVPGVAIGIKREYGVNP
jgi:hypothetical protein